VLYRHEPDSVLVNTEIPFVPRRDERQRYLAQAQRYLEALCDVRATKVCGQTPIFDKSYRSALQKRCFVAELYLAKAAERLAAPVLRRPLPVADCMRRGTAERVLHVINSVDSPWRTVLFSDAKPNFRFIHIVRHPCGVVNSRLRGIESRRMASTTYLRPPFEAGMAEGFPFSLEELEASGSEEKAAFLWMICNQQIHDEMAGREGYCMVLYDDLCRALEPNARRLFDFAGLSWNDQTMRFIDELESTAPREAGYFNVLRAPLTAVDKWRQQLTGDQIERIERVVSHSDIGRRFLAMA